MKHIASGTDGMAALRARLAGKLHGTPSFVDDDEYCPSDDESDGGELCVVEVARAQLPTRYGRFVIVGFYDGREHKEFPPALAA